MNLDCSFQSRAHCQDTHCIFNYARSTPSWIDSLANTPTCWTITTQAFSTYYFCFQASGSGWMSCTRLCYEGVCVRMIEREANKRNGFSYCITRSDEQIKEWMNEWKQRKQRKHNNLIQLKRTRQMATVEWENEWKKERQPSTLTRCYFDWIKFIVANRWIPWRCRRCCVLSLAAWCHPSRSASPCLLLAKLLNHWTTMKHGHPTELQWYWCE